MYSFAVQTGSVWSSPGVLDNRSTFGGQAVHGNQVYVSPRQNSSSADTTFKINGKRAVGWSQASPFWNSTSVADSIYTGEGNTSIVVAVLNDDNVVFHGGVLAQDESWEGGKVHLVQYSTRVPSGVTLNIEDDAIVKFCDDVNLIIDSGATLVVGNATFTHIADDAQGGDTNLDGDASSPKKDAYKLTVNGTVRPQGNPYIHYLTPTSAAKLYTMTASNCTSDRSIYFQAATVYLTTTPIPSWPEEENVVTWKSTPSVTITKDATDRFAATLKMPASNVTATATVTKQQFNISTIECTADVNQQTPEGIVTLTASIPKGQPAEEYIVEWSSEPAVTITPNAEDHTKATFEMPHSDIAITCTATRKTYQLTIANGFVLQDGEKFNVLMLPKDGNVTIQATLIEGVPAEDFVIDWSIDPDEVDFAANSHNKASVSYKMPNHAVKVTIDAKQMFYITTETSSANVKKALPNTLISLTATIPDGQPAEEYTVEWSSEPAVTITRNAEDHTKATFEMPDGDIAITCTVTRKTYQLTIANGFVLQNGEKNNALMLPKDGNVTIQATLIDGVPAEDFVIDWSIDPDEADFAENSHNKASVSYTMPNHAVTVTIDAKQMFHITTDDNSTADLEKCLPDTLVTLTAIIPEGQPPEEYTVEWSSEPEVTITPDDDDHTKATFEMPDGDIAITCTVTRKKYLLTINAVVVEIEGEANPYSLTIENGAAVKKDEDGKEVLFMEIELEKGEVIDIQSIQYDVENWIRMIGWTTDDEYMKLVADATSPSTTFTMPNTPLTLTANYEEMPFLPEDTDKSKDITLMEYLPAKDAMQSHYVDGDLCTLNEVGNTVYPSNENVFAGEDGDYIRRSVKPAIYAEGSTIEVSFEISNTANFESLAILENIPENWHWSIGSFGSAGPILFDFANTVNGVVWTISDSNGKTISQENNLTGVPQTITFSIKPDKNSDLSDKILLNSIEAVGNNGNSYLDVTPADSELQRGTPHWADANKDLQLSEDEILGARKDLITIILNGGKYVWDGTKFIPYSPLEATRAGEYEEEVEITRQLSCTDFDLGSQVSVTLDLSSLAMSKIVSFKEKLPEGWKVVDDGGGKVAKDGSFILFDFDLMDAKPSSVTYTLQAPTLFAEQEYRITSVFCKGMDNGSSIDVLIPDSILRWSNPKPSLTVHTSSQLAQWRVNGGEWLESGARLSVETDSAMSIQLKLPDGNVIFDTWLPLDEATTIATPQAESLAMTMPNHDVVLKARLVSPRELVISSGWNFLCKTVEMAEIEWFYGQTICFLDQRVYKKTSFQQIPFGTVFWLFSFNGATVTLYPEAVRLPSNCRLARLQNGWQGIGSPDARLNCLVKPDDSDSIFCFKDGDWVPFDSQNGTVPLSPEQGYFLYK